MIRARQKIEWKGPASTLGDGATLVGGDVEERSLADLMLWDSLR